MAYFNSDDFRINGESRFKIKDVKTKIPDIYDDKQEYEQMLDNFVSDIDKMQSVMYAHDRYGLLIIFQAMDAAGKDGTIKHVLTGVNPLGVRVENFKKPTTAELDHDYLWRCSQVLPMRGTISIFNRSYYEEVLVVKVRPEILLQTQRLPLEETKDLEKVFDKRYKDIRNYESYLNRNGIKILKFFLNVSKKEQGERLIERIQDPLKNWKFEENDVKEREKWDEYMQAFEDCINETATKKCPWFVVPADDKKNMRLIVGQIILEELHKLNMDFPQPDETRQKELQRFIDIINGQNDK